VDQLFFPSRIDLGGGADGLELRDHVEEIVVAGFTNALLQKRDVVRQFLERDLRLIRGLRAKVRRGVGGVGYAPSAQGLGPITQLLIHNHRRPNHLLETLGAFEENRLKLDDIGKRIHRRGRTVAVVAENLPARG